MNKQTNDVSVVLIDKAVAGDKQSLEELILGIKDLVFNLSLRMLGSFHDAEDASQEILMKITTRLAAFKKESSFTTWVFAIAVNHLKNYRKHMFARYPLSFEFYGDDIENANVGDVEDLSGRVEKSILAEELKMSCTNVMLQCLDVESRCVFVLGTMFKLDSRIAGEVLSITPEAYRQKLSRVRKKMADFLSAYCGEYGSGKCRCEARINYAVQNRRIDPAYLDYTKAKEAKTAAEFKLAMEEIDDLSQRFAFCKTYQSPESLKCFIESFLNSALGTTVKNV